MLLMQPCVKQRRRRRRRDADCFKNVSISENASSQEKKRKMPGGAEAFLNAASLSSEFFLSFSSMKVAFASCCQFCPLVVAT